MGDYEQVNYNRPAITKGIIFLSININSRNYIYEKLASG